jgi:hypothetical protein
VLDASHLFNQMCNLGGGKGSALTDWVAVNDVNGASGLR